MKTYCKHLVVSDENKIFNDVTEYLHDKYKKGGVVCFFSKYTRESKEYVRENFKPGNKFWIQTHLKLSCDMAFHIRNRTMKEHIIAYSYKQPLIRYKKIKDRGSGKERILGLETLLFRLYEVVTRNATEPMFQAKVGVYQCSSIEGRGQIKRKRLVKHVIFYADDIVMYSSNKRELRTAVDMMMKYMVDYLGMTIKSDWIIAKTMFKDADGVSKGVMLDYMGFRFHSGVVSTKYYAKDRKKHRETWVTIRRNIFLTARRKLAGFSKKLKNHIEVTKKFAMSITSTFGWFKNTNMVEYRKQNHIDKLVKVARKIVSDYAKGKKYNEKKYYKMWRQYYACCK